MISVQNDAVRKVGRGRWALNGSIVKYPCIPCDKGNHVGCTEEKLREKGHITGERAHCGCLSNNHQKNNEG